MDQNPFHFQQRCNKCGREIPFAGICDLCAAADRDQYEHDLRRQHPNGVPSMTKTEKLRAWFVFAAVAAWITYYSNAMGC
jgi:hypothetical protein